ncbi:hypothetical protein FHR81_003436 [Actinoalloteichus hoggarensis]|nr:hypothetical protein [Actinoalloteichus hoggarensis]
MDLLCLEDFGNPVHPPNPEHSEGRADLENRRVPLEELLGADDGLVRAGKAGRFAVAFMAADRAASAMRISARDGLAACVAVQPYGYSLVRRRVDEVALAEVVARHGLAVLPFDPIRSLGFWTADRRFDGVSPNALVARACRLATGGEGRRSRRRPPSRGNAARTSPRWPWPGCVRGPASSRRW